MRFVIKTKVDKTLKDVFSAFDEKLFIKLSPPFPPIKLLRFDGCNKNDEVHLELHFIFFKQKWVSIITENKVSNNEIYFVDKGLVLPFFLKEWKHKHLLKVFNSETIITDDIEFKTGSVIGDVVILPLLYLQFMYRKPIYKKYFAK